MIFVLIDTNVILDFALRRGNNYAPAAEIMSYIVSGRVVAHVSASQITDIYYFIRKEHPHEVAIRMIANLIDAIQVLGISKWTIERAIESGMEDFEDAVQAITAQSEGIEVVVTRDQTGFTDSSMTVFTPQEFLTYLDKQ